ncbi:MAG TPA: metallophosphoesterase [Xanthobacteraceae bacterium]|jgi:Icc-related predicted phosphoesterase|nr:metallophosphoesterase [Xanthobacteraceae bacterium]
MRLLLVADLHYSLPQFDWVVDIASDFDVVVLAGDHLDLASLVDGRTQSVVVRKYFSRLRAKTRVLICSGNHDLDAKHESGEKVAKWLSGSQHEGVLSDGESVIFGDTMFTCCPWWDGPIVRASIGAQLAEAASKRSKTWIWIHHAPPANSPTSWGGNRYFGDVELREWIEQYQPDMVFSGHVHQSPFVNEGSWVDRIGHTWVFNAGQQFGAPPTHIIIDTDIGEALWFSAAGIQRVRLDAPLERPVPKLQALPDWLKAADRSRAQGPV